MPKQLNVNLAFTADTSAAKQQIKALEQDLKNLVSASGSTKDLKLTKDLVQAKEAAGQLRLALQNATTSTGSLDLSKFNQAIKASGMKLEDYRKHLSSLGPEGQQAFAKLAQSIIQAEVPLRKTNALLDQFKTTLVNTARWQISSSILHGFIGALQGAYGYAQDLNKSLNNIRIVTGASVEEMSAFADRANKAAQALSTTTTQYTDAALIYYQQGIRDQEEIAGRTETTIKLANVSRQSAEEVSQEMTAIWNNFYDGSKSLEYYADAITALGATTASSSEEIATGLEKFAAISKTVGLSYEYATAALATITAQTRQSAETVGTGLRTLFSRLEGLKLGETLEDGVDLNKYSKALDAVGVKALDASGELRNMDDILDDLGGRWDELSKAQQVALAQTVGGVRQYTNLIALMDNWDKMQTNVLTAQGSKGTLQQQADIYAESWEAAQKRVKAAAQSIYSDLLNDKFFISLNNSFADILEAVDSLIDGMGGLKTILPAIAMLLTKAFGQQMAQSIDNMVFNMQRGTDKMKQQIDAQKAEAYSEASKMFQGSDTATGQAQEAALKGQLDLSYKLKEVAHNLTEEEIQRYQASIDTVGAIQDQVIELGKAADKAKEAQKAQSESMVQKAIRSGRTIEDKQMNAGGAERLLAQVQKQVQAANKQEQILNKINNLYAKGSISIDQYKSHLENLKSSLAAAGFTEFSTTIQEVQKAIDLASSGSILKFEEQIQKLAQAKGFETAAYIDNIGALESMATEYDWTEEEMNQFIQLVQDSINKGQTFKEAMNTAANSVNNLKIKMEEAKDAITTLGTTGQVIVRAFQGISSIVMGLNALKSAFDTLKNPDASGWEKFSAVLIGLSMGIPGLISGFGQIKNVMTDVLAARNALTAAELAGTKVETTNLALKGADVLITTTKAVVSRIAASAVGHLTTTQMALNAALLASPTALFVVGLLAIVAAVAAVVFVIKGLINWYNKDANAAKKAAEEAEEFKEKANEAKQAADDLRSTIDGYDSCIEKLASCTKGTQEWRDALREAGTAALETMNAVSQYLTPEEYQELINYYREHKELDQDLVQLAQERADAEASTAQYASAVADKHAADADLNSRGTNLAREIAGAQGYGKGDDHGGGRATADTIKKNLNNLIGSSDVEDFKSRLQKIGVNIDGLSNETLNKWRKSVEDMGAEASKAANQLQLLTEVRIDELLGDKANMYSDAEKAYAAKQYQNGNYQNLSEDDQQAKITEDLRQVDRLISSFGEEFVSSLIGSLDTSTKSVDLTSYAQSLTGSVLKGLEGLNPDQMVDKLGWSDAQISQMADALGVPAETITKALAESINEAAKNFDSIGEDLVAKIFKDAFHNLADNENLTAEAKQQLAQNIHDAFEQGGEEGVQSLLENYNKLNTKELNEELSGTNDIFNKLISTLEEAENLDFNTITEQIKSLHDAISSVNEVGDSIDAEAYSQLPEKAKEFFAINSEGEYELIGNAQDFKNIVDNIDVDKLSQLTDQINNRESALDQAQTATASGVDLGSAAHGTEYNGGMVFAAPEMDKIETQIALLESYQEELNISKQDIADWTEGLINGNATADEANGYLEAMAEKCRELGISEEQLAQLSAENTEQLQNLADATAMSAKDFDELQQMLDNGQINAEAFNKKWQQMQNDLGEGIDTDELEDMTDFIGEAAGEIKGLSDDLDINAKALKGDEKAMARVKKGAREVAKDIARFDRGVQSISENMETWEDQLASGDIQEHSKAIKGLQGAYGDLLDVSGDNLSEGFLTNAKNMRDLELAAQGDEDAYNRLAVAARQDMAANIGLNDEEFQAGFQDLMNKYYEGQNLDDLEVGASLNDEDFLNGLSEMVNAAGMTAQQATDYLSSMGVDAEVIEDTSEATEESEATGFNVIPKPATGHYSFPQVSSGGSNGAAGIPQITGMTSGTWSYDELTIEPQTETATAKKENKAFSLKVTSAQKSSGGGFKYSNSTHGGGSGGGGGRRTGGGRGRGGGGSGSTRDPKRVEVKKEAYKPREETERYHVVRNQLESINKQLTKIDTMYDRAFGANKLALLDKQIKKQKELISKQKEYVKEIEKNLKLDKKNLQSKGKKQYWSETDQKLKTVDTSAEGYLGMSVQFDKNGDILNYDELMKANDKMYNKAVDEFNKKDAELVKKINAAYAAGKDEEAEKLEKEREKLQRIMEKAEAQYEGFIEGLEQYEETYDLYLEQQQQLLEEQIKYFDKLLEKADLKVQLKIDVSDDTLKLLDFMLDRVSEDAYKAAERIALLGSKADESLSKIKAYKQGFKDLFKNHGMDGSQTLKDLMNGDISAQDVFDQLMSGDNILTEEEVSKMREWIDGILEETTKLAEYRLQVIDEIGVVMDANMDKLDQMVTKMEHLKNITQSYKNIVDLTGRSYLNISSQFYDQMEKANVDLSKQALEMAKTNMDFANDQLDQVRASYNATVEALKAQGKVLSDEEEYHWQQQIQTAEDYAREMTDNYYSAWQDALEAVNTRFESMMTNMVQDFGKAMSGMVGSLEGLKDRMDLQKKIRDVYLPEYERIYQLTKLTRDAQKQIDETNNVKVKRELQKVQEKILNAQKEGQKLSQYDIDFLQRELELKAAQLALEEAQQVKSQVRMTRDSEGNYSYVYTADNKAIEEAESNYAAKLYEMQKLNEEYIDDLQSQLVDLELDYAQALQAAADTYGIGTKEYYDAIKQINADYNQYFTELTSQMSNALANQQLTATQHAATYVQITGDIYQANAQLTTSWAQTLIASETGYNSLTGYMQQWASASKDAYDKARNAAKTWEKDMTDPNNGVFAKAGVAFDKFKGDVNGKSSVISEALKQVKTDANTLKTDLVGKDGKGGLIGEMKTAFDKLTNAVVDWEKKYSAKVQAAIKNNTKLVNSINEVISAASTTTSKKTTTSASSTTTKKPTTTTKKSTTTTKKPTTTTKKRSNNNSKYRLGGRKYTIKSGDTLWDIASRYYGSGSLYTEIWANNKSHMKSSNPNLIYPNEILYLNTGGYTGDWAGTDGRLAMLHQKELVLNARDTENMLAIVGMVREIAKTIELNVSAAGNGLGAISAPSIKAASSAIDQNVHITAEFPNATNRNEILAAFDNVINLASQYAHR